MGEPLPMPRKAMVLAAGLGTRLRPLTEAVPKPAVPICGIPPLRWTLALLASAGVEEAVVNTHWQPDAIRAAAGDAAELGLTVHFSHEDPILGTGGGLKRAEAHFREETFYLVNGKLLFDADLAGAVAGHRTRGATATMILRPLPEGSGYASVDLDPDDRVRRIAGRPAHAGPLRPFLFTGVHVLEPAILDELPPDETVCINRHAYARLLDRGAPVHGFVQPGGYWAEPSTPERYLRTVIDVLGGRVRLTAFRAGGADPLAGFDEPAPGVFVHPTAEVHPTVQLRGPAWLGPQVRVGADVRLGPGVALEGGARVGAGARLRDTVVWPGTRIAPGERLDQTVASGTDRVDASG